MFENIFIRILQMSFMASIAILVVFIIRFLLRKAPKIFSYILWSAVLFRLLCPVSFSSICSVFSVFDRMDAESVVMEYINPEQWNPSNHAFINTSGNANADLGKSMAAKNPHSYMKLEEVLQLCTKWIWLAGIIILVGYNIVVVFRLHKKLKDAMKKEGNIYISRQIDTPFVLGIIKPCIYLPDYLEDRETEYILLHEQTHIRRKDYLFRFLSFIALCIHWFNPLVWAAFFYSGKDMEMSCDEAVINRMGENIKKEYSTSLLNLTTGNFLTAGFPLQFGESDTRRRVKNVLRYKKITISAVAGIMVLILGVVFVLIANPEKASKTTALQRSKLEKNTSNKTVGVTEQITKPEGERGKTPEQKITFQEMIQGGIVYVNAKSIARSAKCIDTFTLAEDNEEWDSQAEEMGLAFAESCVYRINFEMNKIKYKKVDFNTFADAINAGGRDFYKYCKLTFEDGVIVAIDLVNGNYLEGISYIEKVSDSSWYERVVKEKLYDAYIKIASISADVAKAEGIETIEIYTDDEIDKAETGMILVKSSHGEILYSEKIVAKNSIINRSINWGTIDGIDFLMTVHAENRDIYGEYSYEVFRLDEQGGIIPVAGSAFAFDDRRSFSKKVFQKWTQEMDKYYKATKSLICSQDTKIIAEWNETDRNKYHDDILKYWMQKGD